MTAPSATELPTAQPKVPANSRHPGPREFPAVYSLTIPRIAVPADGYRDPVRQLKTVRRPPIYPNGAQAISPAAPSPPFRCPHAVHRWIRGYVVIDTLDSSTPLRCAQNDSNGVAFSSIESRSIVKCLPLSARRGRDRKGELYLFAGGERPEG